MQKSVFPSLPFRMVVIGKSRSGKTSTIIKWLASGVFRNKFDEIYIICSTIFKDKKWVHLKHILKKENITTEYSEEFLNNVLNKCSKNIQSLLIIDDMGGDPVKKGHHKNLFDKTQMTAFHYNLSIWSLWQQISTASSPALTNSDMAMIFFIPRMDELDMFYKNFGVGDMKLSKKILYYATSKEFNYLLVNRYSIPRYYDSHFRLIYDSENLKDDESLSSSEDNISERSEINKSASESDKE